MHNTIRRARPADADIIVEFNRLLALETEQKALDAATLTAGVAALLADPRRGWYVMAEAGGQVVGQLGVTFEWSDWRNGFFWWIQSVYVTTNARRSGVFRQLYEFVQQEARRQRDVIGLRLYMERHNQPALATYREMGMVRTEYEVMEMCF